MFHRGVKVTYSRSTFSYSDWCVCVWVGWMLGINKVTKCPVSCFTKYLNSSQAFHRAVFLGGHFKSLIIFFFSFFTLTFILLLTLLTWQTFIFFPVLSNYHIPPCLNVLSPPISLSSSLITRWPVQSSVPLDKRFCRQGELGISIRCSKQNTNWQLFVP